MLYVQLVGNNFRSFEEGDRPEEYPFKRCSTGSLKVSKPICWTRFLFICRYFRVHNYMRVTHHVQKLIVKPINLHFYAKLCLKWSFTKGSKFYIDSASVPYSNVQYKKNIDFDKEPDSSKLTSLNNCTVDNLFQFWKSGGN